MKDIPGYKTYWLSGEKEGYSGTALFSKKAPIKVSFGISKQPKLSSHLQLVFSLFGDNLHSDLAYL